MRKYTYSVRYALAIKKIVGEGYGWGTNYKTIEVSANSIYEGYWKAVDELKKYLLCVNPLLKEDILARNLFVNVEIRL